MLILTEILAHMMLMMADVGDANDKATLRNMTLAIRKAIVQARAIEWIRETNKTDPIEYLGVMLTVPAIVLQ